MKHSLPLLAIVLAVATGTTSCGSGGEAEKAGERRSGSAVGEEKKEQLSSSEMSVSGEIFVKLPRGTDALAGVPVLLYDEAYFRKANAYTKSLLDLNRQVEELRSALIEQREDCLQARLVTEEREALQGELAGVRNKGSQTRRRLDLVTRWLADLRTIREEFDRLGHASYQFVDNINSRAHELTSRNGKKGDSLALIDSVIAAHEGVIASTRKVLEETRVEFERLEAEVAERNERLRTLAPEDKATRFAAGFLRMQALAAEIVDQYEILQMAANSVQPLAKTTSNKDGKFVFPPREKADVCLAVFYDWQYVVTEGQPLNFKICWVEEVRGSDPLTHTHRLTSGNSPFFYRLDQIKSFKETRYTPKVMDSLLKRHLREYDPKMFEEVPEDEEMAKEYPRPKEFDIYVERLLSTEQVNAADLGRRGKS